MIKRKKKTKQEKTVEEYFPIDTEDLKSTVEKVEKIKPAVETVIQAIKRSALKEIETPKNTTEKTYKKPKKKELEKVERKTKSKDKFSIPKISLKEKGYELIITEKPQAAMKIANALGKATQKASNKNYYYEVDREGKEIIVACAVGHLFTLSQKTRNSSNPVFDIQWTPNYLVRKGDLTKTYYDTISKLCKNDGSIIVATDYDIEGEVIGMNIIKYICGQKYAARMKFSTLTNLELNEAYNNRASTLNWGQGIAGETRDRKSVV